jgi:DNA-binding transcriptional ArsR family regulator
MESERVRGVACEIRVGSGFEALAGAVVLAKGEPTPAWPSRVGEQATEALAVHVGDPTGEVWLHLLAAATDVPGEPDTAAISDWLARQDPRQLRRVVVGADVPAWRQVVDPEVLTAAAECRPEAVARMLADPRHYAGRAAEALAVLGPLEPVETQQRLVRAFDSLRAALPPGLEQELHDAHQAFLRDRVPADSSDALAVLDHLAGGFEWAPEPGITRLVLVPHLAASPRLLLLQHRDARVVGIPLSSADEPALLAAAYAAVGDEQRLQILRLLSHDQLGVSEIARRVGIAKSTAHHHLAALRRAGLIRLVGQAWRYAYRTREDAPDALAARLRLLLSTPPELSTDTATETEETP